MLRNIKISPGNNMLFLIVCCVLFSCGISKKNAPIESARMENILRDMHFAEAYSSIIKMDSVQKKLNNKNMDSLAVYYKQIFAKYHTGEKEFSEAMQWYSLHPALLDSVYGRILPQFDSLKAIPVKKKI